MEIKGYLCGMERTEHSAQYDKAINQMRRECDQLMELHDANTSWLFRLDHSFRKLKREQRVLRILVYIAFFVMGLLFGMVR